MNDITPFQMDRDFDDIKDRVNEEKHSEDLEDLEDIINERAHEMNDMYM